MRAAGTAAPEELAEFRGRLAYLSMLNPERAVSTLVIVSCRNRDHGWRGEGEAGTGVLAPALPLATGSVV